MSFDQEPAAEDSQSQYFSMVSDNTTLNSKFPKSVQQNLELHNDMGDMSLIQWFSDGNGNGEVHGGSVGFGDAPGDGSEI